MSLLIFLLSFLGFINAFYINYQHRRELKTGQKMFCLIGGDCGGVVGSKYGKTFGIKNEVTGMAFYSLVGIYSLMSIFSLQLNSWFGLGFLILIGMATIFSFYLLYIQTIVLKKYCSWCLIAIAINLAIFYLGFKLFV